MPGRRTFNGCWTCRSRKVKCDGQRESCARCEKAGLTCKGYDIKLSYYQSLTVSRDGQLIDSTKTPSGKPEKHTRRKMSLVQYPPESQYQTFAALNGSIDRLDTAVASGAPSYDIGPFRVYASTVQLPMASLPRVQTAPAKRRPSEPVHSQQSSVYRLQDLLNGEAGREELGGREPPLESDSYDANDAAEAPVYGAAELVAPSLMPLARLSIHAIKGPDYHINDQNIHHITYPTFFPNIDSDDWVPGVSEMEKLVRRGTGLTLAPLYVELLREFSSISAIFLKVKFAATENHPDFWTLYVKPLVDSVVLSEIASRDAEITDVSVDEVGSAGDKTRRWTRHLQQAIHGLVLSVAAFRHSTAAKFRIRHNTDIPGDIALSICLRKRALNMLNFHLDEYDDIHEAIPPFCHLKYDTQLLLAIVLQLEIDTYYNVFENLELLFSIGELVAQGPLKKCGNDVSICLVTMFEVMTTMYKSTQRINVYNYQMSESDMDRYDDLHDSYDLVRALGASRASTEPEPDDHDEPAIVGPTSSTQPLVDHTDYNDYTADVGVDPLATTLTPAQAVYAAYGVPQSLCVLLDHIVTLANHKRVFYSEKRYPRNFPKICSEFEEKLERWHVQWDLRNSTGKFKSRAHQAVWWYIQAVHAAIKIYFRRLIKSQASAAHVTEISRAVQEMQQDGAIRLRLPFWVGLMCANETNYETSKAVIAACFGEDLTYWRAQQVIIEMDKRRAHDPIIWMELVREWDIALFLG
ncbi:hypothetical protein CANTEDRAFT_133057 [Yamadazyma tenuis ATCC 10573]|uniref:Zn(2)-C6 fungal-type domain-containing protein n=2 Tax=Candida tenuis TaxID=2315449 RepID=G3AXM9_CANTC|nr:uncharacterized protein CANTEDRAFT_133057 [Yamadazyma tenuis ATCC 10573]EGV65654.1 hypothetical protein CANTEDRAFT_133057 [Yamadazyma tenuis ATCC 10573]